jgi:hypothetical protein
MVADAGVTEITGLAFTVTVAVMLDEQPAALCPVTVYVVVVVGLAVGEHEPVDGVNVLLGVHEQLESAGTPVAFN